MQKRSPVGVETDLESLWTYVPCPTLVVDQAGVVRASSASPQSFLPAAIPGSRVEETAGWLSHAHDLLVQPSSAPDAQGLSFVSGCVGGRKCDAPPAMLPGGEVAWSLVEDSGQVLREAQHALAREQERAAFLLEASSVLMASLNIDRCREATAQLAARDLADAAVVVASAPPGRRVPIFYGDSTGAVEQRSVEADPMSVT